MRRRGLVVGLLLGIALGAGCGSSSGSKDDAAPEPFDASPAAIDAAVIDAGSTPDAGLPDSGLAGVKGDPRQQVTSASGRVSGGEYTVDVQFGHSAPQQPASSATRSVEGPTPIKP